ncbi:uncharacterized protein [Channa argus]|uniref:uncharacterized protein n=1 Tax=Channa argus TaxID=215402 RepID=UPI00352261CF
MNNSKTEGSQTQKETAEARTALKKLKEEMEGFVTLHQMFFFTLLMEHTEKRLMMALSQPLLEAAVTKCPDQTTRQWLRENSESFFQLVNMFTFLKKHIDEEEKKNHSDDVDIIFVAHGSIRLPMIPANCLMPLSNIRDVVLYSPWNCVTDAIVTYGVATGKIKPEHRIFYLSKNNSKIPDEKRRPANLPNQWNSLKKAGGQKIPTLTVSPLHPEVAVWERYESLTKKHGPPGRNRIVIPFFLPGQGIFSSSETVPVYVVTLALSLVLLSSRFKATVHLDTCLSKMSGEMNLDENHLKQQYSCAADDTGMTLSDDVFGETLMGFFKRLFS